MQLKQIIIAVAALMAFTSSAMAQDLTIACNECFTNQVRSLKSCQKANLDAQSKGDPRNLAAPELACFCEMAASPSTLDKCEDKCPTAFLTAAKTAIEVAKVQDGKNVCEGVSAQGKSAGSTLAIPGKAGAALIAAAVAFAFQLRSIKSCNDANLEAESGGDPQNMATAKLACVCEASKSLYVLDECLSQCSPAAVDFVKSTFELFKTAKYGKNACEEASVREKSAGSTLAIPGKLGVALLATTAAFVL
ncbi:hypothetical protein BGZ73_004103 [Actinomortierella ambigua]|nr:hypothetical protein BGZ73_004103 [Actinomortierella ambigua]